MEWRTCPGCGKERPDRYFPRVQGTGERSELCAACRKREQRGAAPAPPRSGHPGPGTAWTSEDVDALLGGRGRTVEEVAGEVGRTRVAVMDKLKRMGVGVDHGRVGGETRRRA